MVLKRIMMLPVLCMGVRWCVLAAPVVSDLKVTAIPPWGLALDYTVEGVLEEDANWVLYVTAVDGEKTYSANSLVGATNCVNGAHRVYWNMAADGLSMTAKNSKVVVSYLRPAYCVIDMSAGSGVAIYPVCYFNDVPSGGWSDEYKTNKIVLRRIDKPSGTYYAGVFEITEAQWAKVMGSGMSGGTSTGPKCSISYFKIRGTPGRYDWPGSDVVDADSFMGRLRRKTGLDKLDLPSEEEWEYAARAGVTTRWLCGDDATDLGDYAWYSESSGHATHFVGTLQPNAWGLYDVHGNVEEWCLDRFSNDLPGQRALRGGSYNGSAGMCTFASRYHRGTSHSPATGGFRLFCRPGDENPMVQATGVAWSSIADGSVIKPVALALGLAPTAGMTARALVDGVEVVCTATAQMSLVSLAEGRHALAHDDGKTVVAANYCFEGAVGGSIVSDVTARQRYPWNGLVDIDYTITGEDVEDTSIAVTATDLETGRVYTPTNFLESSLPTGVGTHRITWDTAKDSVKLTSANVVFEVSLVKGATQSVRDDLYCVIDLSGGPTAERWPVSYLSAIPTGGWTDEYKTTKLVLRRIEKGYISGLESYYGGDHFNAITITSPYYIGVFEVTRAQYQLITGIVGNGDSKDKRPQDDVTYVALRGATTGVCYSPVEESSVIGVLQKKTSLDCELPTARQWEYACRAGTTTWFNNGGSTLADLNLLGRYSGNKSDGKGGFSGGVTTVGSYLSNRWGLYDMHGNAAEWCLDSYSDVNESVFPDGQSAYPNRVDRVLKGGAYDSLAQFCTSGSNRNCPPDSDMISGFRLCINLEQ